MWYINVHVQVWKAYMKFVLLPLSCVLNPIAVIVIQPQRSSPMSFAIQPVTLVLVFVGICDCSTACGG